MLLLEKQDGHIKGRKVYNGKPMHKWLSREDAASPTVSLESVFILLALNAKDERDVLTVDIPNAFIQTPMKYEAGEEWVIMKITGVLVDMLAAIDQMKYANYVIMEIVRK